MSRIEVDGVGYHVEVGGEGPPLLLIHGFTGRGSDWDPFLPAFREFATTITVDLLGHGDSDSPFPERHAIDRQARDIGTILLRLGAAPADVLGYSLGARVALRLVIDGPELIARLILESPSLGVFDPKARAARVASDEQLAQLLERNGIEAFVEHWQSQPIFASESSMPEQAIAALRVARLRNRPEHLAASLRGAGQGTMEPLISHLSSVTAPTLVIAGEREPLGLERAETAAGRIPDAWLVVVPRAGHAVHRQAPIAFTHLVVDFLREGASSGHARKWERNER